MNRKSIIIGWLKIVLGLLIFSLGVHLTIRANLGLAPWDCLGMGISFQTPLNYGLSMTMTSVMILLLDILMKEKIGFGTIPTICWGEYNNFCCRGHFINRWWKDV